MGTTKEKETASKTEKTEEKKEEVKEEKKDPALLTLEDVREHCRLLERSVVSKESRFAVRVMRGLPATRKKLTSSILKRIVTGFYTHSTTERDILLDFLPDDVSLVLITTVGQFMHYEGHFRLWRRMSLWLDQSV